MTSSTDEVVVVLRANRCTDGAKTVIPTYPVSWRVGGGGGGGGVLTYSSNQRLSV